MARNDGPLRVQKVGVQSQDGHTSDLKLRGHPMIGWLVGWLAAKRLSNMLAYL